jgi:hypothetical protein
MMTMSIRDVSLNVEVVGDELDPVPWIPTPFARIG